MDIQTRNYCLSAVAYLKGEMTDDQEVHITLSERASPVLRNLGHGLLLPISLTKVSISLMCNIITLPTRCSIAMNSTLKQLLTLLLLPKTRRGPTLRKYKLAETILKEFSRALSVEVERMSR